MSPELAPRPRRPDAPPARKGITIREAREADSDAIWGILRTVVESGDAYAFDPGIDREAAMASWLAPGVHPYVAEEGGRVIGSYVVKANQPGLGSHVANAAYMVAPEARGRGVGRAMGEHSLAAARRLGFRAMQFNLVVSTNHGAVELWKQLGFAIVGTLPRAFRHQTLGFVDAYVMFREL